MTELVIIICNCISTVEYMKPVDTLIMACTCNIVIMILGCLPLQNWPRTCQQWEESTKHREKDWLLCNQCWGSQPNANYQDRHGKQVNTHVIWYDGPSILRLCIRLLVPQF